MKIKNKYKQISHHYQGHMGNFNIKLILHFIQRINIKTKLTNLSIYKSKETKTQHLFSNTLMIIAPSNSLIVKLTDTQL